MNSQLSTFFESLKLEADLDKLRQEHRQEDLHLEFKEKSDRRSGRLNESDRKGFSKALSGFANADGGILIFGIANEKRTGIDCAGPLKPITGHEDFRSRLLDSILNATHPAVDGVGIESIHSGSGSGYVKCLIPQSDKPPHRAVLADREYYRRTSNGHQRMEHYELEDVFGRRLRPSLKLKVELHPRPDPDEHEELHFSCLNEGRGVAKHFGLFCALADVKVAGTYGGMMDVSAINDGPHVQCYQAHGVIHPNGIWSSLGHAILKRQQKRAALSIELRWYAENMQTRYWKGEITPEAPKVTSLAPVSPTMAAVS
ncbi:MAG: ATP-binding protein [Phycisphaerales bacterium]|nr:ATP-binding protein [Phycisphaerales bacterium]